MKKNNLYYNSEGYPDPTAYHALKPIVQEEKKIERKAHNLVSVLKFIVEWAGFEFIGRIQLRHKESGKEFK